MKSELVHYVRTYDDTLAPDFCRQLVQAFESSAAHQKRNGRGVRAGLEESEWTELDITAVADEAFIGFFLAQIEAALERYNRDVALDIAVPLRPAIDRLTLKRYRAGGKERFQPHFDSIDAVCGRYLVFLWYLNDVESGGETRFVDLGVAVSPKAGRLLMFPPFWMFQHAGMPPISNDKYILSTYLMFGA